MIISFRTEWTISWIKEVETLLSHMAFGDHRYVPYLMAFELSILDYEDVWCSSLPSPLYDNVLLVGKTLFLNSNFSIIGSHDHYFELILRGQQVFVLLLDLHFWFPLLNVILYFYQSVYFSFLHLHEILIQSPGLNSPKLLFIVFCVPNQILIVVKCLFILLIRFIAPFMTF